MAEAKSSKLDFIKNFSQGSRNRTLIIIAFIVLIILVGYFFYQYQTTQSLLKNPSQAQNAEAKQLVDKIGSFFELPTNESPTIATVSDVTKLADQPFFAKAINGDRVLVYTQNKMLILFRPSINKIITVGTVNVAPSIAQNAQTPQAASPTPTPTQAAKLQAATATILNGTQTAGLAKKATTNLQSLTNITVSKTGDTIGSNYPNTLVIDVSGNNKDSAAAIAKNLGGKVQASIPDGEIKPATDILVILGSDYK